MRVTIYILLAFTLVLAVGSSNSIYRGVETVYEWRFINYVWPSKKVENNATLTGRYDSTRVIPMDVDKDRSGRIFMTFLGNNGTPANLGVVTEEQGPGGPLIAPYPNWSWFASDNCNTIQNAFRMKIDECNLLWVLDNGQKDGLPRKCPPKLVLFDLDTDFHLQNIVIPENIAKGKNGESLMANPTVDTDDGRDCGNPTVYIADADGNGLIMFRNKKFYRYEHQTFQADPDAVIFHSGNDVLPLHGGIVGLAVAPRLFHGDKKQLYYRPLNSYVINSVDFYGLGQNATIDDRYLIKSGNVLPSQAVTMAFSSRGTLFFGLTTENAIGCWNRYRTPLTRQNIKIIDQDPERYQFLSGVKVIKPSKAHPDEELWLLSNRFVGFRANTLKKEDLKFRVMKGSVQSLVKNTKCDLPNKKQQHSWYLCFAMS